MAAVGTSASRLGGRVLRRRPRGLSTAGLESALRRSLPPALIVILPLYLTYGAYLAASKHGIGLDFRGELYPEAKLVLHGTNPFPPPGSDLSGGVNRIWPIPAALLVSPLTGLPVGAAGIVFCLLLVAALVVALRLLGVHDWQVCGLVLLWPVTLTAIQSGNLSILLMLLVAVAWRYRDRRFVPGLAVGLAVALKLYLWPLGVWLLARRQFASVGVAGALTAGGMLLVLPFTSLTSYLRLMHDLGNTFGPQSYNVVGLLDQTGIAGLAVATLVSTGLGLLVLVLSYRRRSLPLAVAASLLLSPIVWSHYLVLLVIPVALAGPRLGIAWAIPLVLYVCPANGPRVVAWNTVIVLAVVAIVTLHAESRRARGHLDVETGSPAAQARLTRVDRQRRPATIFAALASRLSPS